VPSEIDPVQQKPDQSLVAHLGRARPGRARQPDPEHKCAGDDEKAQGQKGHRTGMRQAELGADEPRAPEQHEERRGEAVGARELHGSRAFPLPARGDGGAAASN